jgi:glycosyltransferase involved in cell wall biosynthesis
LSDRLSIVVATTHPWPEVRACLDSLRDQARTLGAEILLVDGDGQGLPERAAGEYPNVKRLERKGASVFSLRALGIAEASGDIIAITEDHCRVAPEWCERILVAHRENPEAAAIGGAVENGATSSLIDWANFALVFSPFMPPVETGESEVIALQANISYKRRVIPRDMGELGMMEMLFNRVLRERGEKLVADGRILVQHHQSHDWFKTFASHFHNGRSIAGYRLRGMSRIERVARMGSTIILPPFLLYRTLRNVYLKGRLTDEILTSVPLIVPLVFCHAAGELIGYIKGPGDSPRHID